jgi:endoglucanase
MKKIILMLITLSTSLSFAQIVTNGNFQTGTAAPWYNNAANVVDLGGGNFVNQANVATAGPAYSSNLSQIVNLTSGLTYELKFDAFTDTATGSRTMIVGLGQSNDPYVALTSTTNLTSSSQTFTYQYTINYGEAVTDRVIFDMGAATGFVFIDNVSVTLVTNTCSNGIQDGSETGVDCGGSCSPCIVTPTVAAPTPPNRAAADVKSIYSDAYSPIAIDNLDAGWCGVATTAVQIAGNNTLRKNSGVACQGIDFRTNRQDLTNFTYLHFDFYITDTDLTGDVFNVKLVNFNGTANETSALEVNINGGSTPQLVANQWVSVDVPITALGGVVANSLARNDIAQIGVTTANVSSVWYDNIYLHKGTVLGKSTFDAVNVRMYPNPANNVLNFDAKSNIENVSIYNLLGQEVIFETINKQSTSVNISNLQSGVYVVKTSIDGKIASSRLIKE